ncbi:MAG: hypothetical protein ABL958_14625, partial [Bdellovibrionia bacterium]
MKLLNQILNVTLVAGLALNGAVAFGQSTTQGTSTVPVSLQEIKAKALSERLNAARDQQTAMNRFATALGDAKKAEGGWEVVLQEAGRSPIFWGKFFLLPSLGGRYAISLAKDA